jgi:hypothetical protein
MNPDADHQAQRGTIVMTSMTLLGGGFLLLLLFLACGGLWLYVIMVVAGMAAFTGLQYVLWGRAMSAEVAREQAAEAAQSTEEAVPDREEAKDWTPEERSWYRRF